MKKRNLIFIVSVMLILCIMTGCAQKDAETTGTIPPATEPSQPQQPQPTQPQQTQPSTTEGNKFYAPDFTVYNRNGEAVKLSDFRGKPVILNFWSSKCPPCRSEMPDFQQAFGQYGDEIHFVMVNLTDGYWDTTQSAIAFVDSSGYTFPIYLDTDNSAASTYGILSIPTTFFIDTDGCLVAYFNGMLDMETLLTGIGMIQK